MTSGFGGGMYNAYSSPSVSHCAFSGNTGHTGGAISNWSSSPTVADSTFSGNTADLGGGMYNRSSSPKVTACAFNGNTAATFSGAGGGMFNYRGSPTVNNCTFSGNTANDVGGGMFNYGGNPTVTKCTFTRNTANDGGGMYNNRSTPSVLNCTFSGNTANIGGGGMYNGGGTPRVTNCTFGGNTAACGSGMYNYRSDSTVTGSILFDDGADAIVNDATSTGTFRFSDVQGGLPVGAVDGGGNIDLDPMFVRLPNPGPDGTWDGVDDDYGDLRLRGGSPCIDTGDPGFVAQPGETDLEGHARVLCGRVDMGAYEYGIGDYDCDQSVNLTDLAGWVTCVTGPTEGGSADPPYPIGCEAFDFDGDGDVDLLDFSGFQRIIGR